MVYDLPRTTNVTQLELILELLLSSDSMQSSSSLSFNSAKSAFEKIETFLCKSSFFLIKHLGFWCHPFGHSKTMHSHFTHNLLIDELRFEPLIMGRKMSKESIWHIVKLFNNCLTQGNLLGI